MYSKLITPQSRTLYHGASPEAGERPSAAAVTLPPSDRERRRGRRLPAACSELHSFPSERLGAAWEGVLIVVSSHFTPQITNEHHPGRV